MKFEVRETGIHPSKLQPGHWTKTFSVGVGPAAESGKSPAAWYRVKGKSTDWREVDALAERLRAWLEENTRLGEGLGDRCPIAVVDPWGADNSARIVRTPAGKAAGFYGPSGPGRGE